MNKSYIERNATDILKGVALIFMFIHHFFTFPMYYIDGISYPYLEGFAESFNEPFKICVSIFAFLTGYFYVFAKNKRMKYSLKKATDVWAIYFVFFILLLIPAVILGCWEGSGKSFLMEAVGIYRPNMIFCWYVDFYILSVLLLPLYHLAAKKHILIAVILGIALPIAIITVLKCFVHIPDINIEKTIHNFFRWFPCIASGYIFAQFGLFEKWFDFLFKRSIKSKGIRIVVYFILMGIAFFGRRYLYDIWFNVSIFTVDFILAPLFIYGLLNLYYELPYKKALGIIAVIGRYSLGMWFFHCIFFNICKKYTQPILYFPKNPIFVLIWGLALCLLVSFAVTKAITPLLKWKNKILFKNT